MEEWGNRYINDCLEDYRDDDDLDPNIELPFNRDVLEVFKTLLDTQPTTTIAIDKAATSIAARVNSESDPEAKDILLAQFDGFIIAAMSSPLDTSVLAEVVRLFILAIHPYDRAEQFRTEFSWGLREEWNGPNEGKYFYPYDKRTREERIQNWVGVNELTAHLVRTNTVLPSEHFASWTLGRAFGPNSDPADMLDYHVPAAAAWIRILGREIREFCVVGDPEEFDKGRWDGLKRG
ncbi:hypothetical protein PHISCL_09856, partial [Aspergillus sclerotialis]